MGRLGGDGEGEGRKRLVYTAYCFTLVWVSFYVGCVLYIVDCCIGINEFTM